MLIKCLHYYALSFCMCVLAFDHICTKLSGSQGMVGSYPLSYFVLVVPPLSISSLMLLVFEVKCVLLSSSSVHASCTVSRKEDRWKTKCGGNGVMSLLHAWVGLECMEVDRGEGRLHQTHTHVYKRHRTHTKQVSYNSFCYVCWEKGWCLALTFSWPTPDDFSVRTKQDSSQVINNSPHREECALASMPGLAPDSNPRSGTSHKVKVILVDKV